jgi:hypothetical protein
LRRGAAGGGVARRLRTCEGAREGGEETLCFEIDAVKYRCSWCGSGSGGGGSSSNGGGGSIALCQGTFMHLNKLNPFHFKARTSSSPPPPQPCEPWTVQPKNKALRRAHTQTKKHENRHNPTINFSAYEVASRLPSQHLTQQH